MWTRSDLKAKALQNLKVNYWKAFLVSLILIIMGGSYVNFSSIGNFTSFRSSPSNTYNSTPSYDSDNNSNDNSNSTDSSNTTPSFDKFLSAFKNLFNGNEAAVSAIVIGIVIGIVFVLIVTVIYLVYRIFLGYPMEVGARSFYKKFALNDVNINYIGYSFKGDKYMPIIKSMFLKNLFLFLWSLFVYIPVVILIVGGIVLFSNSKDMSSNNIILFTVLGIITFFVLCFFSLLPYYIKSISYMFVPYILTDNPHVGAKRAMEISTAITDGHKFNILKLFLSLTGWIILGFLACCIGLLFVMPYIDAVFGQLYVELRKLAIDNGVCNREELCIESVVSLNKEF